MVNLHHQANLQLRCLNTDVHHGKMAIFTDRPFGKELEPELCVEFHWNSMQILSFSGIKHFKVLVSIGVFVKPWQIFEFLVKFNFSRNFYIHTIHHKNM